MSPSYIHTYIYIYTYIDRPASRSKHQALFVGTLAFRRSLIFCTLVWYSVQVVAGFTQVLHTLFDLAWVFVSIILLGVSCVGFYMCCEGFYWFSKNALLQNPTVSLKIHISASIDRDDSGNWYPAKHVFVTVREVWRLTRLWVCSPPSVWRLYGVLCPTFSFSCASHALCFSEELL